ncbi:F0F1 ATP synthase subunit A [Rubinisphaera sp. JC750]|uniref:F0F1 ATP synthase subunit A n=1 Tax=Rubinisphaera sp. JC750 TaxID=2898658 RepID=UPI001F0124E7|nr:F0F1 ATP synthase subunit A [Rubinisphaera sp. JC750]
MASPVLHVKDAYYYEVPKTLWPRDYKSLDEVPQFIRDAHPHATLEQINYDLSGKILIPQPFGELKNLYEVKSGFGISRFMLTETIIAIIVAAVFIWLARRRKKSQIPTGRRENMMEAMVAYVRDEVARPAIGHGADKFVPFLLTAFFFILACNLLGMIPGIGTVTSSIEVTAALAFCTFSVGVIYGIKQFGPGGYLMNFVPHIDLPWVLAPLKFLIFLIEILGMLIKHCVLAIRLFGNMVAGHMVLAGVLGAVVAVAGTGYWVTGSFFGILGATALSILEILVAFIQAYVFTMLSALFIGMSVHEH